MTLNYKIEVCPECGHQRGIYEPGKCGRHIDDLAGEHYPQFIEVEVTDLVGKKVGRTIAKAKARS